MPEPIKQELIGNYYIPIVKTTSSMRLKYLFNCYKLGDRWYHRVKVAILNRW